MRWINFCFCEAMIYYNKAKLLDKINKNYVSMCLKKISSSFYVFESATKSRLALQK